MNKNYKIISVIICILIMLQLPVTVISEAIDAKDALGTSDSIDYKLMGSIGGSTNAVAVSGNYVYVGKGTSILILESSGGKLTQVGEQLNLPTYVSGLAVQGTTLYAAVGSAGLYIIDISDPLKLLTKGVYTSSGYAEALAVKGSIAYLANGVEGLQIIDVSNSTKPFSLGQVYKGKYAFGVTLNGDKAYIAAGDDGLLVADVSQSSLPRELSTYNTKGIARDVAVSGQYAYVADDWKGVSIVNISNPSLPVLAKEIHTAGRAYGLTLDKSFVYVADAYMGIRVFDVTSLSSPKDLTSFIPANSQLMRIVSSNGLLFCADRANGILCFDITKPGTLNLKGFYSHTIPLPLTLPEQLSYWDNAKEIYRLVILGVFEDVDENLSKPVTRAELSELLCKALRIKITTTAKKPSFVDVSLTHWAYGYIENAVKLGLIGGIDKKHFAPDSPMSYAEVVKCLLKLVNRQPITGKWPANSIAEADKLGLDTVFFGQDTNQDVQRANALAMLSKVICEIADKKTNMTLLQSKIGIQLQAFPMQCTQIAVQGKYTFATCGEGGLSVLDTIDPENIRQIAHLDFPESVGHIRISGKYVYLPAKMRLYVVDISDPIHPVCISAIFTKQTNGPPRGVDIDSGHMYIADEWGMKIISLKDPAKPVLIKHEMLMGKMNYGNTDQSSDIAVRNGIAYISMGYTGTLIYDVSDPENPKYLSTYVGKNYRNYASNILFSGNVALSANFDVMDILDISDIRNPKSIGTLNGIWAQQFYYEFGRYSNMVILPNDSNGVVVVDISEPANIKRVCDIDMAGMSGNVQVEGKYAYVANGLGGLGIISLDPKAGTVNQVQKSQKSVKTANSCDFKENFFIGVNAEEYYLDTDKTLNTLKKLKKAYTQTLTVTNTEDSGQGSLRWCLETIKQGGCILFDPVVFSTTKPGIIYSKNTLQFNSDHVTIDASNSGVILDGSKSAEGAWGISVNTEDNVIKGLKMQNFKAQGIFIVSKNNIIGGSRKIGKGPSGEGNVIVKSSAGLCISGQNATGNIVVGNNIGVDSDGITPAGNAGGLDLREYTSRNVIGIDVDEYRNVVSNTRERGLTSMENAFGNLIEGNYVGTDVSGTKAMGNYNSGITFELCGYGSIVRNNVSCSNGVNGILLWDVGCNYNVIIGNYVGIASDKATVLPNLANPFNCGFISMYNVFGGKDSNLQNHTNNDYSFELGSGVYDTILNGKVYKFANTDRY